MCYYNLLYESVYVGLDSWLIGRYYHVYQAQSFIADNAYIDIAASPPVGELILNQTEADRKSVSDSLARTVTPPPFNDIQGNTRY